MIIVTTVSASQIENAHEEIVIDMYMVAHMVYK